MIKIKNFLPIIFSSILFFFIGNSYAEEHKEEESKPTPAAILKEVKTHYKIGAGSVLEGYFYIGLKLCDYITKTNQGVTCDVVTSDSSTDSLNKLRKGEIDFAFVQSNIALDAFYAVRTFANMKQINDLKQVLSLHDEIFTVIVKDDDKILVFGDIDGKKISNGPPMSDSSVTYSFLRAFYDFHQEPTDIELSPEKYATKFCKGDIDAIMLMTGHPNALVSNIANSCNTEFVKIEEKNIDKLVNKNRAFKKITLKAGKYPGITEDRVTVAVPAIFVTLDATDKKLIENFLVYLRANFNDFKASHPVLSDLKEGDIEKNFVLPKFNEVKEEPKPKEEEKKGHH